MSSEGKKKTQRVGLEELRYKVLHHFQDAAVNRGLEKVEPFKEDIASGKYTKIHLRDMISALYQSGLLQALQHSSSWPNAVVYDLTHRGRDELNELSATYKEA